MGRAVYFIRNYTKSQYLSYREVKTVVDGRKIRELRESAHMTITELAGKVGCSQPQLTYIEQGFKQPGVALLKRIADQFNVTMESLLVETA